MSKEDRKDILEKATDIIENNRSFILSLATFDDPLEPFALEAGSDVSERETIAMILSMIDELSDASKIKLVVNMSDVM